MDITKPVIHLNGTSREALIESYQKAAEAVNAARNACFDVYPHGRDYYPVAGSYERARAEHDDRLKRLSAVLDELMELTQHCDEAGR